MRGFWVAENIPEGGTISNEKICRPDKRLPSVAGAGCAVVTGAGLHMTRSYV